MSRGVILNISRDKISVFSDDCDFLYIKSMSNVKVGQEVEFNKMDIIPYKNTATRLIYMHKSSKSSAMFSLH